MHDLFAEKIIAQFFENVNSSKKKRKRIFKKTKISHALWVGSTKDKKWLNLKKCEKSERLLSCISSLNENISLQKMNKEQKNSVFCQINMYHIASFFLEKSYSFSRRAL